MRSYILVVDEMGTPGMAPGTSNTFVFGGYVVKKTDLHSAAQLWRNIKLKICGRTDVELKWKHFFIQADHPLYASSPLLTDDAGIRRDMAEWALDYLFQNVLLIPSIAVARKNRATGYFVVQSSRGKDKVDDDLMWLSPIALFAIFLDANKAQGQIWMDELGSDSHQTRRQQMWSGHLKKAKEGNFPRQLQANFRKLLTIEERIEFLDSAKSEPVQIADFICGVIWQAGEGDESYLSRLMHKYGPNATRQGLGIIHIE